MSRYISAEWLIKESMPLSFSVQKWVNEVQIMTAPSIDIVRCQDCRHRYMDADLQVWTCTYGLMIKPNGFCNYGERKEGE